MNFSDKLLEAKGFENHYLVKTLAGMNRQGLIGRLPAIARKRTGPIDRILREMPRIVERSTELDSIVGFSVLGWDLAGAFTNEKKETYQLNLHSLFSPITAGLDVDGTDAEAGALVAWLTLPEFPDLFMSDDWAVVPFHPTEAELSIDREDEDRLRQHPVYALVGAIRDHLFTYGGFQFHGQDKRVMSSKWLFSYGDGEERRHVAIEIDRDRLESELSMLGL